MEETDLHGNRSFERGQPDEAAGQYSAALHEADRCIGCVAIECAAAAALRNRRRAQDAVLSFVAEHGIAGPSCAFERPITHLPPSPVLH